MEAETGSRRGSSPAQIRADLARTMRALGGELELQGASVPLDLAHKQRLPSAAAATHDEEDDCNDLPPAADLDDGDEHAPALDAKLSRKVPMLLEQYLFKTAVPYMCTYMYI